MFITNNIPSNVLEPTVKFTQCKYSLYLNEKSPVPPQTSLIYETRSLPIFRLLNQYHQLMIQLFLKTDCFQMSTSVRKEFRSLPKYLTIFTYRIAPPLWDVITNSVVNDVKIFCYYWIGIHLLNKSRHYIFSERELIPLHKYVGISRFHALVYDGHRGK